MRAFGVYDRVQKATFTDTQDEVENLAVALVHGSLWTAQFKTESHVVVFNLTDTPDKLMFKLVENGKVVRTHILSLAEIFSDK